MSNSDSLSKLLQPRQLWRDTLEPLDYYYGGLGFAPLVILNAYGQSLAFWERLLPSLTARYRIFLLQPRGTLPHGGMTDAHGIDTHMQDMRALLDAEGIQRAHVLAWCTGPKTALAFCDAYPERVASMTFLSGSFVREGEAAHLATRYENDMRTLCAMLKQRPQLSGQLAEMLTSRLPGARPVCDADGAIASLVKAPFATPDSLAHYARQLRAFWNHDMTASLARISVPTLFIGAECDEIAHPRRSREMASRVPGAIYVEAVRASHYLHYEQPAFLADVLAEFTEYGYCFAHATPALRIEYFPQNTREFFPMAEKWRAQA